MSFMNLDAGHGRSSIPSGSSLFLISQSFLIPVWEGSGVNPIDLGKKLQDFHLAGFSMGPWTPPEFISWRITIGHLRVLQILFLHQIFDDELLGLPVDEILLPSTHPNHI